MVKQNFLNFKIRIFLNKDKIGNFIDFCSISNISVLILTHTQYGYYIHGRSVQGSADKSMSGMIAGLRREESNLTSKRGLGSNSSHQTFSVLIQDTLNNQYTNAFRLLNQVILFLLLLLFS